MAKKRTKPILVQQNAVGSKFEFSRLNTKFEKRFEFSRLNSNFGKKWGSTG